jgi:hypothetical protein
MNEKEQAQLARNVALGKRQDYIKSLNVRPPSTKSYAYQGAELMLRNPNVGGPHMPGYELKQRFERRYKSGQDDSILGTTAGKPGGFRGRGIY